MSTDIQDRDLTGRKRSHRDFLNQEACGSVAFGEPGRIEEDTSLSDKENDVHCSSRGASASSPLTEPARSPLAHNSPSPKSISASLSTSTTSTKPSSTMAKASAQKAAGEPPKKKRLTAEEKAARDAALEAEKRKKQEEREKKRREKEEAEKLKAAEKAAEKAAKAAEKAKKEQEKKQQAEEKEKKRREKEEEEAKKARSQMKLTSMFNRTPATPKKELATSKSDEAHHASTTTNVEAKDASLYEKMFKPFFVKEHVRLASNPYEMDEETRQAKTKILEEYIAGVREAPTPTFDPLEWLQIPCRVRRGRVYPSVRKLMAEFDSLSNSPAELTTESQSAKLRETLQALKSVPVKSIKFREDVRPPYIGTISGLPPGVKSLRKLARNPISKTILPLNYDYDSEAEWQEEEGEDVDDLDDEEEEGDMDEDMADFLDDSEQVELTRVAFSGGMEVESTGPCWEDRTRKTAEPTLYKYRLEFILEPLEHHHSIDPFSSAYWKTSKPKASAGNESSTASASKSAPISTSASTTTASNSISSSSAQDAHANRVPAAPSDALKALTTGATTAGTKKSQQPLPPGMQQKLKDLVRSMPTLSKVGVIELFAANNPGCPRGQIKTSFDALFEKSGKMFKVKGE
ncbi:chromatin assembly factor 1 subunit A-domain-containing protein [Achaetomium macrosporum]|uniref:Chromatin assembly factor 1 subunit A-domain-containing protein n=1 Tax=Achaetomium macrosporum TaxID=79813 RepID=A0AAN7CCT1_9PEZI|nr:chromatin assembly factor 1 subunit A-domain-containing protein [Achaetomium macrosporum]